MGKSDKNKGTKENGAGSKTGISSSSQTQKSAQVPNFQQPNDVYMFPNQGYNQAGFVQGQQNTQFNFSQGKGQGQQQGQATGYAFGNYQFDPFVSTKTVQSTSYVPQNFNATNCNITPDMPNQCHSSGGQNYTMNGSPLSSSAQSKFTHVNSVQMPNYVQGSNGTPSSQNNNNSNQMYGSLHELIQQMNTAFMNRLDLIDQKVSKLDPIERDVSFTRVDVARLKQENTDLRRKVDDVEKSCSTISSFFDNFNERASKSENNVYNLQKENSRLQTEVSELKSKYSKVSEDLLEVKTRAMQENLLIFGIGESPIGEKDYTEEKLRDFLVTELNETEDKIQSIVFDRVHRIGRPQYESNTGRL